MLFKTPMLTVSVVFLFLLLSSSLYSTRAEKAQGRAKRELPNSLRCDVRSSSDSNRCFKGDLIDTSVADCKYKRRSLFSGLYCLPVKTIKWHAMSSVVDVEKDDDCKPVTGKPVTCGTMETRCVCDKAVDFTSHLRRGPWPNCRCQYWPVSDQRETKPSACHQYDQGGRSTVHFYSCCNNCNDTDKSCMGETYQGGGATDHLCGQCGQSSERQKSIGARVTYTFNCKSCKRQRECNESCNTRHPRAKKQPGLCPLWIGCFRRCCLGTHASYRGKRSEVEVQP